MRTRVLSFLIFCSLFLNAAGVSFASTQTSPYPRVSTDQIAQILQDLVREVDSSAYVVVMGTPKKNSGRAKMPGTPFMLDGVEIDNNVEPTGVDFERLDVSVFAGTGKIPEGAENVIRTIVKNYADEIRLKVLPLPADYLSAREKNMTDSTDAAKRKKALDTKFGDLIGQISEAIQKSKDLAESVGKANFNQAKAVALGVLVAISILGLVVLTVWFALQRKRTHLLEKGLTGIKSALESSERTSGPSAWMNLNQREDSVPASATSGALGGERDRLASLHDDGMLALLSDCYWCEQDAFGAFVWRRLPADRKIALMERMPALEDYGRFLMNVSESDLGVDQDPSYLRPLPIAHLDMQTLTKVAVAHPRLLFRLSPLRSAALRLRPKERLLLNKSAEKEATRPERGKNDLPELPRTGSTPRFLKRNVMIEIHSEDEELEVLDMENKDISLIAQVPSLGWLKLLPRETAIEILRPLSARDLATAWVGPTRVLEETYEFLSEKKKEMLKSQLERTIPSRNSPVLIFIHQRIVEEIQQQKLLQNLLPSDAFKEAG